MYRAGTATTATEEPVEAAAAAAAAESDRQLVARTLAGDTEAFATLHRRYFARVYRLALFKCHNPHDAEDIASETFVRAISHLSTFRFRGDSIFPWLSRICANLVADGGRRAPAGGITSLDAPTGQSVRALLEGLAAPPDALDPHTLAERHEVRDLLRQAIAALPLDQADAVLLRFGGDLPLKEIALALNRSEGAIKSLLHRALVGLRKSLLEGAREAEVFGHLRRTTSVATTADTFQKQHNDVP